jgi:hypothetical protein
MRNKFRTANSDALRFSCLETPIDLPKEIDSLLTDEEKLLHME